MLVETENLSNNPQLPMKVQFGDTHNYKNRLKKKNFLPRRPCDNLYKEVVRLIKYEPEFLTYGLWIGTIVSVCLGLVFSASCGVFAAVNAATTPSSCFAGIRGLYVWNFLALITDFTAIGLWLAQYFLTIQYNVMSREDKDNMWTSEGMAELGYSFWFVVGAAAATFVDIIIIYIANSESKETSPVFPVLEEKSNGAIMLY